MYTIRCLPLFDSKFALSYLWWEIVQQFALIRFQFEVCNERKLVAYFFKAIQRR